MNRSSSTTEAVSILLQSLQRICRNLSHLLNVLDEDVDSFERLLTQITSSIHKSSLSSSSSSSSSSVEQVESEDFYEQLCDEQLEPKPIRVTAL